MPMIVDDLFSERVFCTYHMHVCDMDEYEEIDIKEDVYQ